MKFEEAAKLWGAAKLRRDKISFDEIDHVYFRADTGGACPTCGPEVEYEGSVWFYYGGKKGHEDFRFYRLDTILKELFELSEDK